MCALRVMIVGAGIGGLSAALALARQGASVTVIEKAPALAEVGAGLQISPNASRVLHALGLSKDVDQVAFRPECVEGRTWKRGIRVSHVPLGRCVENRYGAPYLHIHRADLLGVLVRAVTTEPRVNLLLGTPFTALEASTDGVSVTSADLRFHADLLIGADGIRSAVRTALFGEAMPRFTGNVAWRLVVPAMGLPEAGVKPVAGLWMGPGAHLVHYYLRRGSLLNVVAIVERDDWEDESWSARGERDDLLRDFRGWHPVVGRILDRAPADGCYKWALFDRDPLPQWSKGAVTLLGDACHPTLPFMAQGACMAIEDAAVLAACLRNVDADAIPLALQRYESLRKPRTTAIQTGSRANAGLYHMRAPRSWVRNILMRHAGKGLAAQAERLYGYDALVAASGPGGN